MPKNKTQLNALKESRKQEIVECALKIFCEKGYDGATINDIVKKAKCSHGLFYHYFDSKKAIFEAVSTARGKFIMDFLDQVLLENVNYVEKLKKLTEYTFSNMIEDEIFAYRYYFFLSTVFNKAESGFLPPKNKVPPHVRMSAFFEEGIRSKVDIVNSEYNLAQAKISLIDAIRIVKAFVFGIKSIKNKKYIVYRQLSNFTMTSKDEVPINLDGERSTKGSFVFNVWKQNIQIIPPKKEHERK